MYGLCLIKMHYFTELFANAYEEYTANVAA